MKKYITIILSLLMIASLVACSSLPDPDNIKLPVSTNDASPDTSTKPTSIEATDSSVPNETTGSATSGISINEQLIYEKDGIRITALCLTIDDFWGPAIKVLIENDSSQNITVQTSNCSINDLMTEPMFSCDVAAGKKANDEITFMESDLAVSGISVIAKIEFNLHIFNSDTWDDIADSDVITLNTSASNYTQVYNDSGFIAYDNGSIKIVIQKLSNEDSFWGSDVYVYAENNTNENITIQTRDVSIDGFMVDPFFSCDIVAGKKAYDTITFMESDLEDNGITDIKELELKFTVFNSDSWQDILDTDIITVAFK